MIKSEIIEQISERNFRVGVIGLGYVGLPLAVEFASKGFNATGFEVDLKKVEEINSGQSYIGDVSSSLVKELVGSGTLNATTDFDQLKDCGAIIICVPTPLR
jgi:UDP-N-acetyl-D-glucosamine dehydrogenase